MPRWSLLGVAWLTAFNLRAGMFGLPPVLPAMMVDLALTHAQGQLIFGLPLLLMGLLSVPAGILADRLGARATIALGLGLIAGGELLRAPAHSYATLLLFTLFFGAGLGITQPALPKLVQQRFADRATLATGVYTSAVVVGATTAAALTGGPYFLRLVGGWRGTFLFWGAVACLSLVIWLLVAPGDRATRVKHSSAHILAAWRAPGIGSLAALYLAQTVGFYTLIAWLPTYLSELGWSAARIQGPFSVLNGIAIPSTIIAPYLMERAGRRRPVAVWSAAVFLAGVAGFSFFPNSLTYLWAVLAGITNTVPLILAMALPVELVRHDQVASATGFLLTIAYGGAIIGPPAAGWLRDLTGLPVAGMWPALVGAVALVPLAALVPERLRRDDAESVVAGQPVAVAQPQRSS